MWQRCSFARNRAAVKGGAIFAMDLAYQAFVNCSYKHNAAVYGGSGHFLGNSTAAVTNTRVEHSRALASPKGDGGNGGRTIALDGAQVHILAAVARRKLANALQYGLGHDDWALFKS
jgi:predicted outer membrane repeat protein